MEQTIQLSKENRIPPMPIFTADTNVTRNPLESLKSDTGHILRQHLPVPTDADEKRQQIKTLEDIEQDAKAQHPMKDTPEETTPIQSERLHTLPTSTNEVIMPTRKVGAHWSLVT